MQFTQLFSRYLLLATLMATASQEALFAQADISVYATGLISPIGLDIDAQGRLWVGEEGSGNDDSRVSVVTTDGQVHPFLTGLSSEIVEGDPLGVEHVYFDANGKLLIAQGEGGDFLSESILMIDPAGFNPANDAPRSINDLQAIHKIGAFSLSQGAASTNPYALAIGPDDNLYIVDAGLNGIVKLERCTGNLSVFATFDPIPNPTQDGPPFMDAVPTGIVYSGNKFYVGLFVGFPFMPDSSRIMQVDLNGNVSLVKKGLTSVVDLAVDPRDGNLVFAQYGRWEFPFAPNSGGVYKLKNGKVETIAAGLNFPTGLHFNGDGVLFVSAFADGQILKISAPLSDAWRLQTTLSGRPSITSVKAVSRDVAWIPAFDDYVYRTTDGGVSWQRMGKVTGNDEPICIEALDSTTAFVGAGDIDLVYGDAKIYRTTDGGRNWSVVYTATGKRSFWDAIHFFDSQNGIALSDPPELGSPYLIVKTSDGGATWTPIANPPMPNPNEAGNFNCMYFYDGLNGWFGSAKVVFTSGVAGRVFRTTDGGNTWTAFESGNTGDVSGVRFVSPLVGIRTSWSAPYITRTTDGGQTWTPVANLPIPNIGAIHTATGVNTPNGNQLWVAGTARSPFILTSTDDGLTWTQQPNDSITAGTILFHLSAVGFGALSDSVRAWAINLDFPGFFNSGQVLTYVNRMDFVTSVQAPAELPQAFNLLQNYPNPFNPETRIRYELPQSGRVVLKIFNMLGQEVRTLVNELKPAGSYEALWDGRNDAGHQAPSGAYLYQIRAEGLQLTKKMVLLR